MSSGQRKTSTYLYKTGGGYVNKLDKNVELVSDIPLPTYGISVSMKNATIASGVGANSGYTVLNGVYATVGKKSLHEVAKAIRINDELFTFHHYQIHQKTTKQGINILLYSFVLEEIYRAGTRTRNSGK